MPIFENRVRDFLGPASRIEGSFAYLDRSGRPEAERVRSFLEEWLSQFPSEHRADLLSRLQSRDERGFKSAEFELVLFACAKSLGYSVKVHPTLPNGSSKHPDFLLSKGADESFYLEAVLASDLGPAAALTRRNVVIEALGKIDSPNFFLTIDAEGEPGTPPRTKGLKRDLENWLASLDPDLVTKNLKQEGQDCMPLYTWEHGSWSVEFGALPKEVSARGGSQRTIGMVSNGMRWVDSCAPIRSSIKEKGSRYGELDKPLLVAVNLETQSVDREDEFQALFGEEEYVIQSDQPSESAQIRRKRNGAWFGPKGPQCTRVSGAWLFRSASVWNLANCEPTVYFNPWAARPLPDSLQRLRHAKEEGLSMGWNNGITPRDILGLQKDWP